MHLPPSRRPAPSLSSPHNQPPIVCLSSFPHLGHWKLTTSDFELAPWELVPSERVLAWVPQPGWGSSPECRWVRSRVDEHESRATSLIEQAGLLDQLTAVLLKQ